ncbi:PREDICTED: G2/mitotic-specific cyclin-A isoform X2 [Polistes dominula]|uniref:G2/mitotic-specific cyclin-A isoform X2 n=1 Tax=Polistes dominula TaxID=743375 RepID=A0ABM1ICW2_POLDO|nr:PREDICTED: G2/mitotic-specific cyclin-A isoform X2 [Polistes dominula]
MATIRVHEDQENRIADIFRGKENILPAQNQVLQQSKRAVLGVLHNNCHRIVKTDICKDEKHPKAKSIVTVPFEPFKIYEDKKEEGAFKVYEDKLEEETSVVLRDSKDDRDVIINQEVTVPSEQKKPSLQEIINGKQDDKSLLQDTPIFPDKPLLFNSSSSNEENRINKESSRELRNNFFDVEEYRADIYSYLRVAEVQHRPKPGYMKKQPDITYLMRLILVDWLVEVAEEYRLQTETLYLAVSYIDRFLSYMSVVRAKLQLVGTAAMFIAAKYEEIYPPDVAEFVYITDDTYTIKQVLRMEHLILRVLSFDLTVPTPLAFLKDYCISNNLSEKIKFLAMYLCELSLLEADPYLQYLPSHLAASSIALARHTLQEEIWPHELELSTGYCLTELKECMSHLNKTFLNAPNLPQQAIQEKYKSSKYGHVALVLPRSTEGLVYEDEESA